MAGFFGWVGLDATDLGSVTCLPNIEPGYVRPEEIASGRFRIKHFAHRWAAGRVGRSTSGQTIFVYAGYVCDEGFDEFARREGATLADRLADAHEALGNNLWTRLNGIWAAAVWHVPTEALSLAMDRMATLPLYYARRDDRIEFSTSLLALMRWGTGTRTLEPRGLLEWLTIGYVMEERTHVSGVETIRESTVLTFRGSQVTRHRYWEPDMMPDPGLKDWPAAADGLDAVLKRAVERWSGDGSNGIALSGGLDSRQVIARMGDRCHVACTLGDAANVEMQPALQVAAAMGVPHVTTDFTTDDVAANYQRWIEINDGHIWTPEYLLLARKLAEGARHAFFGFHGDPLRGMVGCPEFPTVRNQHRMIGEVYWRDSVSFIEEREHRRALGSVFAKDLYGSVSRTYNALAFAVEAPDPFKRFYWYNIIGRQRRRVSHLFSVVRSYLEFRGPITDNAVVEYLLRIPSWMFGKNVDVYLRAFVRHYPELAAIPHARGSTYVRDAEGKLSRRERLRTFWYRLPKRLRSMLVERVLTPQSAAARSSYHTVLNEPLTRALRTLSDMGILNKAYFDRVLCRHLSGRHSRAALLHRLLSLGHVIDRYGLSV
jgi:asparagine synthetase B (glutamine-hydrolysing)